MSTKTKNRIWFIGGLILGVSVIGWGIAQKYLYPTTATFNLSAVGNISAGGFIMFMSWFTRAFVDRD